MICVLALLSSYFKNSISTVSGDFASPVLEALPLGLGLSFGLNTGAQTSREVDKAGRNCTGMDEDGVDDSVLEIWTIASSSIIAVSLVLGGLVLARPGKAVLEGPETVELDGVEWGGETAALDAKSGTLVTCSKDD